MQGAFVRFKAGDRLFAPGDWPGSWVAIERGRVRVSLLAPSGREVTLYRIGAGKSCLLTTSSLIGDEPLPAEGFAETDVEARIVPKATFDRLVAEDPDFRRDVLRNYANRVADLVVTMQDVLFRAIPERLARALLVRESDGVVEATHQAIASELGSAREVVSRVLQSSSARASSRSNGGGSSFAIPRRCGGWPRPNSDHVTDRSRFQPIVSHASDEQEKDMSANVGMIDRIVRIVLGLALIAFALGFIGPATGFNWIGWIGVVPLVTALVGSCPLYSVIGLSTRA